MSERRPLLGRRVLVTRPHDQAAAMVAQLEALGAEISVAPLIRILPPTDPAPLQRVADVIEQFDWIVFASQNAVDALVSQLGPRASQRLAGVRLCAVGPATAQQLEAVGLKADLVPATYQAEAVTPALTAHIPLAGAKVLLPHADIGRDVIATHLREAGADVTDVIAYRTAPVDHLPADIVEMLEAGRFDAVTFMSPSAVQAFVQACGERARPLLARTVVATIGPVTTDAATTLGIHVAVQPDRYTVPGMLDALARHFLLNSLSP